MEVVSKNKGAKSSLSEKKNCVNNTDINYFEPINH